VGVEALNINARKRAARKVLLNPPRMPGN
jgi:hypothetical protein